MDPSPGEPITSAVAPVSNQEPIKSAAVTPDIKQPTLRLSRVLMVVVPVAVIAAVAVALVRFGDMDALLGDLTRPALVPVTGQVLFNGEPLQNGQVMTQPIDGRGASALGWTDSEGKFSLKTDIRGNFAEGATVGEHRVTVTAHENVSMPGGPPLLTPRQYASMANSPLRITIGSDPKTNDFRLVLEGEPPAKSKRPAGGTMPPPRPPGAKKGRSQGAQPAPDVNKDSSDANKSLPPGP